MVHAKRHAQRNLVYSVVPLLPKPKTHELVVSVAARTRKPHTYLLELVEVGHELSFVDFQQMIATPWVQALARHQSRKRRPTPLMPTDFSLVTIDKVELEVGKQSGGIEKPVSVRIGS